MHLWERDCSVQRRHQKVIEMAPAWSLPMDLRKQLHADATRLTSLAKYKNAGTVEFLVDAQNRHYFIEVNPRIQVEHTVTEEVTGIDLVQAQMRIAAGSKLEEIGLIQDNIAPRGVAIQCRVTTEDSEANFTPDTGTLSVYRHSAGFGMRMDGIGYSGLTITPYYDSLLVKYTARGASFDETLLRMRRALQEARIRGVKTNIPFLLNCLTHPQFESGIVTTSFIDENPSLTSITDSKWDFAASTQSDMNSVRVPPWRLRAHGPRTPIPRLLAPGAPIPSSTRHPATRTCACPCARACACACACTCAHLACLAHPPHAPPHAPPRPCHPLLHSAAPSTPFDPPLHFAKRFLSK